MTELITRFFRKLGPDPTSDWPPVQLQHALIDTTIQSVCGIRLPCDATELRAVGRPSNRHALVNRNASYFELGAWFWISRDGQVQSIYVNLMAEPGEGPPAKKCDVVGPRGHCELRFGSRVDVLAAVLGEGTCCGGTDPVWTFPLGRFALDADCTPDGHVLGIDYYVIKVE